MATLRELKTRIGTVASSEKLTGAMKMISSAKVRKSEQELKRLSPFKGQIKQIMGHLLKAGENYSSPLMTTREVKRLGVVVYGSDDGLCGAYNVNIFKFLHENVRAWRTAYGSDCVIELYPVGRKMRRIVEKYAEETVSVECTVVDGVNSKMEGEVVNDFTLGLQKDFEEGRLDAVEVVYMKFYTIGRQRPKVEQLFPVNSDDLAGEAMQQQKGLHSDIMYIFEPDANSIFGQVLPMFVLSLMQEVTIQNRASEQAARIMAMQAANDNAKKLQEELQLEYNKLRQQGITTELLDILGGQVDK